MMPVLHSDEEIDRAIEALNEPGRLEEAQQLVAAKVPQLQQILDNALEGWLDETELLKAAGRPDAAERLTAVRELVTEESRASMLVGVAVGYELAQKLTRGDS
jgi:hypothetical protein